MTARDEVLVSPDWLEARLGDADLRIVEVDVTGAAHGEGHIPGAVLWNIYSDLKDPEYHLRDAASLHEVIRAAGIGPRSTVVFYGYAPAMGFWLMKVFGHENARVLDASRAQWRDAGRPWTATPSAVERAVYDLPVPDASLCTGRSEIEAAIGDPARVILDVRTDLEYQGERFWPSGAPEATGRPGHVPSATLLPASLVVDDDGCYLPTEELMQVVSEHGLTPNRSVISYCTIGGRACAMWLALTYLLGYEHASVYAGSWAEWGMLADTPVEATPSVPAAAG